MSLQEVLLSDVKIRFRNTKKAAKYQYKCTHFFDTNNILQYSLSCMHAESISKKSDKAGKISWFELQRCFIQNIIRNDWKLAKIYR